MYRRDLSGMTGRPQESFSARGTGDRRAAPQGGMGDQQRPAVRPQPLPPRTPPMTRGPENIAWGQAMAGQGMAQQRMMAELRAQAAVAANPQYQTPGWNPNGGGSGQPAGGMTSAVENTGGWQEAAPAARPMTPPPMASPQGAGGYGYNGGWQAAPQMPQNPWGQQAPAPMQQAPQMTTTYAQPPQRQQAPAPMASPQPINPKGGYLGGGQQSQGTTTYSNPDETRMQAIGGQPAGYGMQRAPSHTGANPYAAKMSPGAMQGAFQGAANAMPRYAFGTDNSAAYNAAGMGNSYIPTSNNQHTAGVQLPPALQRMVDMGMPIPPALMNSVTGGVNGPLNMASVFTQRGGGTLPSLQGIDSMSQDERGAFSGYLGGPMGMPEASTLDSIARPTQNLQRAAASRMG